MAEAVAPRIWANRCLFAALAFAFVFARLLPIDAGTDGLPGPDLLLALTCAWVLRRPGAVPVLLVAPVFLMTDVLFLRPLGLWTACVILGLEFLRAREQTSRDLPFLLEWVVVGGVIVSMTLGYRLVLAIFAVDQPALGLALLQMMGTIAVYPLVVFFSSQILGIRRAAPGAVDRLGRRL